MNLEVRIVRKLGVELAEEQLERVLRHGGEIENVAMGAIGVFGYYSRLPILDYLGLVDPVVARSTDPVEEPLLMVRGHMRSNADYILERRPDIIMMPQRGAKRRFYIAAVVAIWNRPDLDRLYVWDEELHAYRRRP